jgi:hypothetical protein
MRKEGVILVGGHFTNCLPPVSNHASGGPILNMLKSDNKQPTPSSFSGNQLSEYVENLLSSGPETGKKLHQTYCFFRKAAQPQTGQTVLICSAQ